MAERRGTTKSAPRCKQIAYLFGAGATHAELANICEDRMSEGLFLEKNSLLLAYVSKRVCQEAKRDGDFSTKIRGLLSSAGLSNVELFISLIQENHVESAAEIVQKLKARIERDILKRIRPRQAQFYLHKALFEFHKLIKHEKLAGIISLNYDGLLDEAYETLHSHQADYGFSMVTARTSAMPLLKLHGGFDLKYRDKKLPIITPGVDKNYLTCRHSSDHGFLENGSFRVGC